MLALHTLCLTAWTSIRESSRASDLFSCHCWTGAHFDAGHMKSVWHRSGRHLLRLSDDFLPPSEPIACKAEAVWWPACILGAAAHKFAYRCNETTSRDAFQLHAKSHFPPLTISFTCCLSHTHRALEHLTALWHVWQAGGINPQS